MDVRYLKNIDTSTVLALPALVETQPGQVVSRTLVQNEAVGVTLFAFDQGERISSHASTGDAMVTVLEGTATITIGSTDYTVGAGQSIVMPHDVPHAVAAQTPFKMLLVVVFPS